CPVRIDLHHHLLHNRRDSVVAGDAKLNERWKFRMFRMVMQRPGLYALGGRMARFGLRLLYRLGSAGTFLDPMRAWNRRRAPVPLPKQSFRSRWKSELNRRESKP